MFGFHNHRGRHGRDGMDHAMRHAMRGGRHGGMFGGGFGPGFEEGFGGRGFGGGGRGGRRRMFDANELKLVLLKLIGDQPRHGYDLIKAIEELSGGAYAPSPGVVYPTLTLLGDMGQVAEQASDGAKRLFAITDAGRETLETETKIVEALIARLTVLAEQSGQDEGSPVRRAMINLHTALHLRKGERQELAHDIAAILDEATRKIERL
jgi:DNA-binding PadR family transcriptional regulator